MKKRPLASIFIAALSLVLLAPSFVSAQSNDYWRQQQQQMLQQQRWQQQQDEMRRQAAERERQRQIEIERQRQIEIERQRQVERQRQIEIERQRQEQLRQQKVEQVRRQQLEEQQKRQADEARRQQFEQQKKRQADEARRQQTAEQQRQQMRIQAMLGTTRPTQVMKAPRNPTPGEIQKGFTGRVTADGRALVKFQNRVLTVPASRISGLSAKLANDNQRKSNWTAQKQSTINAKVKRLISLPLENANLDAKQSVGAAVSPGVKLQSAQKNFDEAIAKYPAQLAQYEALPSVNLKKAIQSHNRQIEAHQNKLANPKLAASGWDTYSNQHQENLKKHWMDDIKRHEAYRDIASGILIKRGDE